MSEIPIHSDGEPEDDEAANDEADRRIGSETGESSANTFEEDWNQPPPPPRRSSRRRGADTAEGPGPGAPTRTQPSPQSGRPARAGSRRHSQTEPTPQASSTSTAQGRDANATRKDSAALTGRNAKFPTLGLQRSRDPAMSISLELHARLLTHKWKMFTWLLRHRQTLGERWRRPRRWLADRLAAEVASIWGHLGAATRALRTPTGPTLFR